MTILCFVAYSASSIYILSNVCNASNIYIHFSALFYRQPSGLLHPDCTRIAETSVCSGKFLREATGFKKRQEYIINTLVIGKNDAERLDFSMGKLQVQVDRLYRLLDEELENFHKDERFFSVQKIMDRYQVNLRVVNGALDRLENAGAIRRERYRGIFCRETRHPDISSILLIMPDFPSAEMDSFAELVRNHITEYPEFRLQLQRFLKNDIDKPPSEEVAAILLFGDSAPPSMEMLTCLADWRKPVIFFCRQYDDLPFSCVNHNNTEGGMLACEYLISHGCRSLLTIHSECPLYDVEERFCAFETYAKLHNVPCRRLNSQISAEESANYHVSSSLTEYLNTYGCHFDGIFLDSYTSAQGVFSALRNYGLRIPDDVSVIAFHGFGEESPCRPPLTTVGCRPAEGLHLLFAQLKRVLRNEIPRFHIQLPMYVKEGGSVRQPV